jgi:predicted phosphoribosyltransferase
MPPRSRFRSRADAGRALAPLVRAATSPPSIVLGLPRGGIAVGVEIARHLGAPLCASWIRRIGSPREPGVVIGAVDLDGDLTLGVESARAEGLGDEALAEIAWHAHQGLLAEYARRDGLDAAALLPGATAIVVDDTLCTGLALRAAIRWARRQSARRVVACVPVVDERIWAHVRRDADDAIALAALDDGPLARSEIYDDFARIPDDELEKLISAP